MLRGAEFHAKPACQPPQQLHDPQHKEHIWWEVRNAQRFDGAVIREGVHPAWHTQLDYRDMLLLQGRVKPLNKATN